MDSEFNPHYDSMKKWIENRIRIMSHSGNNVIVFPIARRANEVEEYRENEKKKKKMSGDSPHISLQLQAESDNIYKVRFKKRTKFDDSGDCDGNPPERA
jgi:hypothetical protein